MFSAAAVPPGPRRNQNKAAKREERWNNEAKPDASSSWAACAAVRKLGYTRFSMRRFEEYALYLENKSFLKSESVLTFTNPDGS
jgi:hypothetical protein